MVKRHYRAILIVLALLVLFAVVITLVARASVNDYIDKANHVTLAHVVSKINEKIRETQNLTYQVSSSFYITPFRHVENIFDNAAYIHTLKLQQWLPSYSSYNDLVYLNAVIFAAGDYVILPRSGQDLESFNRNFSKDTTEFAGEREDFFSLLLSSNKQFLPRFRYVVNDTRHSEVVPYVIWAGANAHERRIAAVTLLDAQALDALLAQSLTSELGALCLIDGQDALVASSRALTVEEQALLAGEAPTRDLRGYWSDTYSPQWRCVLLSYGDEASLALGGFSTLILTVGIAALTVIVVLAMLITLYNRTQLKSLARLFEGGEREMENTYNAINRHVREMLSDKQLLNKKLGEQERLLRELAINGLLLGNGSGFEQSDDVFPFSRDKYSISAIMTLKSEQDATDDEYKKVKYVIKEALRLYSKDIAACDVSARELAMVLFVPQELDDAQSQAVLTRMFRSVSQIARVNTRFRLQLFVGRAHVGDGAAARSYAEARMALLNGSMTDEAMEIVRYTGAEETNACYYYPPEVEIKLRNLIRSGNRMAVGKLIDELFDCNIVQQYIDYNMTVAFLFDFYGSVLKIQPEDKQVCDMQQEMLVLFKDNVRNIGSMEVQRKFIDYIYRLTDSYAKNKKSHNQQLAERMLAYIDENAGNYEMSLTLLADTFRLSSGYCSMFFKEQIGTTFTDHLNRVRAERARRMLEENELSVAEIARAVGYSSSTTFCRAFKKYYGVNPLQVRERQ